MVISFDLDGTLIPYAGGFAATRGFACRLFGIEPLRTGTRQLFSRLRQDNHQIYIYTTSYRSVFYIKLLFALNSLKVDKVINQHIHNTTLKQRKDMATKLPHHFGIDIHIDDSIGVEKEGRRLGFRVVVVEEDNQSWTEKILNEVTRINSEINQGM